MQQSAISTRSACKLQDAGKEKKTKTAQHRQDTPMLTQHTKKAYQQPNTADKSKVQLSIHKKGIAPSSTLPSTTSKRQLSPLPPNP
jgi:hypothetical protein